jgi:hypothetical protein
MVTIRDLIRDAASSLGHSAAALRLAAMETADQKTATGLWSTARLVEGLVEPVNGLCAAIPQRERSE